MVEILVQSSTHNTNMSLSRKPPGEIASISEGALRRKALPALPMFRAKAGDHPPRCTTPDQVRERETQTTVETIPNEPFETHLVMPIPNGVEPSPRSQPPAKRVAAPTWAAGWNSTTGYGKMQPPVLEDSPVSEFLELPAGVPLLKPEDDGEVPHRPGPSDQVWYTSESSSEDEHEDGSMPSPVGSHPTDNTVVATPEGGETSSALQAVAGPSILSRSDHAPPELDTKTEQLKTLLLRAMSADQRLVGELRLFSKQARLRGCYTTPCAAVPRPNTLAPRRSRS